MVKKRVISQMLGDQRVGRFDDQEALSSDLTIKEAIDYGYVTGKVTVITQMVEAVFGAMKDGIQKDGNGRKIDDYLTIQAYLKAFLADPTDEITKENAKVVLRARMLKNFKVDPSDWAFSFVDGMVNFALEVITTGEETDVIHLGEDVMINGRGLELVDGDTVSWSVPEDGAHGTVADTYITSDATRITIARDGLQELYGKPEYDGKNVVFTVRIGNKFGTKKATMKVVE